ncbi:hypothetical protein LF817_11120 [Halobacillus sp. A1]|uniref:hypothetical protein n=1 Tax=Halobacillus sp. A1 TaxID=2880262 RepID=UPI0020A68849|nr:hypothetical protein [Halobacillus sp. A1]MCP3031895.1 hypothetical protein [Halobacillus sp. A1]
MSLIEVTNLKFYSQLSLKQVEDRLLLTGDFSGEFLAKHEMIDPFLYVILYVRGGERIKILDEGTAKLYIPSKKEFDPQNYNKIIRFAMENSTQFKINSKH